MTGDGGFMYGEVDSGMCGEIDGGVMCEESGEEDSAVEF